MISKQEIINQFNMLVTAGNIGFYNSCEVTELFLWNKKTSKAHNLFILCVFEERDTPPLGKTKLTKKPIVYDKHQCICIVRYYLSLGQIESAFESLIENGVWQHDTNNSISLSNIQFLSKQFIPKDQENSVNLVLRNNFLGGSYILEVFDVEKKDIQNILSLTKIKKFNEICAQIKNIVPIDLSVIRDRCGNIIFQFPMNIVNVKTRALPGRDGLSIQLSWDQRVKIIPTCTVSVVNLLDGDIIGTGISKIDSNPKEISITTGNFDGQPVIQVWREIPDLMIYYSTNYFIREFLIDMHISTGERVFKEAETGSLVKVDVHSSIMSNIKSGRDYKTIIKERVYKFTKEKEESELLFKQYFNSNHVSAISDIRTLIEKNATYGVCLWDPFLAPKDIIETLFYTRNSGALIRAIGSINKRTRSVYDNDEQTPKEIMESYRSTLESSIIKDKEHGLDIEFRCQHGQNGFSFHDRFLIFPGGRYKSVSAWSLGISVNQVGDSHHILHQVSNPQRILDAFDELWNALNKKECIVWKSKN